jgi:cytochrome c6
VTRSAIALAALVLALGFAAAACGGSEEASPTPDTVTGELPTETTETETTDTDTTGTDTTGTETTDTETTDTEPPAEEGDPAAGKEVFLGSSACGACNTLSDVGTSGQVGPNLDQTQLSYAAIVDVVTNGRGQMPSFSSSLSDDDIQNVAAYISQAASG